MNKLILFISIIGMMMIFTSCSNEIEQNDVVCINKSDTLDSKAILIIETEWSTFEKIQIDTMLFSLYNVGQHVTIQENYSLTTHNSYYSVLTQWFDYESHSDSLFVVEYTKGIIRKKLWI